MSHYYDQPEAVYPPLGDPGFDEEQEEEEQEFEDDFGQYPGDYDFYSEKDRYKKIRAMFKGFRQ